MCSFVKVGAALKPSLEDNGSKSVQGAHDGFPWRPKYKWRGRAVKQKTGPKCICWCSGSHDDEV